MPIMETLKELEEREISIKNYNTQCEEELIKWHSPRQVIKRRFIILILILSIPFWFPFISILCISVNLFKSINDIINFIKILFNFDPKPIKLKERE